MIAQASYGQLYFGNFLGKDASTYGNNWSVEVPFGFPVNIKKFNKGKQKLIIEPTYTLAHNYFNDKWVVSTDGNNTSFTLDENPDRTYRPSIFSHRSKVVTWSWLVWLGGEVNFGKFTWDLFYAPGYVQVGSFRRKYVENNNVIKVKDKFKDKADYYNINRLQHRIKSSISYYGIGLEGFVNLTPFFKENKGPDLSKYGVTLIIRDSFWSYLFGLDKIMAIPDDKDPDMKEM